MTKDTHFRFLGFQFEIPPDKQILWQDLAKLRQYNTAFLQHTKSFT